MPSMFNQAAGLPAAMVDQKVKAQDWARGYSQQRQQQLLSATVIYLNLVQPGQAGQIAQANYTLHLRPFRVESSADTS